MSLINSNKDMPLHVVVLNFIDMLSHARTESKMIRELANSDAAYRSITESWFRHSGAIEIFRRLAELGYKVILTTDHGTIRVDNPIKMVGDRNTNTNLRYKVGKTLITIPNKFTKSTILKNTDFRLPTCRVSLSSPQTRTFSPIRTITTTMYSTIPEHSSTAAFHSRRCLSLW